MGKKVIAIVQARMGSERLSGKVLRDISGKSMLWHVHKRLTYSRLIDKIIIATSASTKDEPIAQLCDDQKIACYRGSEPDVLDRYYEAAQYFGADVVVRITGDCPLIDPHVVDKVISAYLGDCGRYVGASNIIKRSYPRGLDTEVFSLVCLKKCWEETKDPAEREHVTSHIYAHPELFKLKSVENRENLSSLRWTVDEEPDLLLVQEIYKKLYMPNKIFCMKEILEFLEERPELKKINSGIQQKQAPHESIHSNRRR